MRKIFKQQLEERFTITDFHKGEARLKKEWKKAFPKRSWMKVHAYDVAFKALDYTFAYEKGKVYQYAYGQAKDILLGKPESFEDIISMVNEFLTSVNAT
jgi:hypothetical protein